MKNPFSAAFLAALVAVFSLVSCEQNALEDNSTDDSALSLLGINLFTGTAVAIEQAGIQVDPTNAAPVTFTIVFAEAVDPSTFDDTDIIQNGTASGITWFLSTADNMTWTLEATIITNPGTLVPSIAAGTVQDIYGNDNRASTSADNSVEYDATAPTVTINQAAAQDDPVNALPVNFTVVFSEAIDPATFTAADINDTASTATGITWTLATTDDITWTLSATAVTTQGTLVPNLAASLVQDPAGNNNAAATSADNSVIYDNEAPVVSNFSGPSTTAASSIGVLPTASDNVGITGWMITETATAPLAGDAGWLGTQPAAYTLSGGPGAYWLYLWVRDGAGNVSVMNASSCFLVTYQSAYPAPVLRTGQTACYDESGTSIACAATGQDGDLLSGLAWPSPRFTNNGLTVTDNLTGLVWTTNATLSGMVLWDAAFTHVTALNASTYGGRSDWRLPNIVELMSIMNYGSSNMSTWFSSFGITPATISFWSSTTYVASAGNAWLFRYSDGIRSYGGKTANAIYAWAVAGTSTVLPQTAQTTCYNTVGTPIACAGTGQDGELQAGVSWVPATRFTNNGDGTITDDLTGLMWAEDVNEMIIMDPGYDMDGTVNDGRVTWEHALDYVDWLNSVNYHGYSDWRLPNVNELSSLLHYEYGTNWLYDSGFNSIYPELPQAQTFWSSTTYEISRANVKIVNDVYLLLTNQSKTSTTNYYTWPVRAGN